MAARGSNPRGGTKSGGAPLDRLGDSLDAAQQALKDLRRELSKGGRDVLKDLEALLRDARKNLRGTQRTLVKDLEEMQRAAAGKRRTARGAPAKRTTRSATTKRTTTTKGGGASARKSPAKTARAARKT